MELNFTKSQGSWVAEFEATSDFNMHIEGVAEGNISVYQRGTASGEYAFVRDSRKYPTFGKVYDCDFSAMVYPKFIKVECLTEPSSAEVTFG